jgi:hypothetical protein
MTVEKDANTSYEPWEKFIRTMFKPATWYHQNIELYLKLVD